jgi:hypothetical protein
MRGLATCGLALLLITLGGCVLTPRTVQSYDPNCKTYQRQATLVVKPMEGLNRACQQQPGLCLPTMVGAGLVTATTTVISGSLVIAGNVVFWLERDRNCPATQPPDAAASATAAAPTTAPISGDEPKQGLRN